VIKSAPALAAALAITLAACGGAAPQQHAAGSSSDALAPEQRPIPAGRGPAFRLSAVSTAVARRSPVAGLRCARSHPASYGVHVELYAERLVLPVPAGIGVAPPQRRHGAYVLGGPCSYPIRTLEPTGVILIDRRTTATLGTLFAIWGRRLSSRSLAGFTGPVSAFVDGRRWRSAVTAIPLRRHQNIVIEVGGYVPPHRAYRFPPGI
jgi:hypothetical protein